MGRKSRLNKKKTELGLHVFGTTRRHTRPSFHRAHTDCFHMLWTVLELFLISPLRVLYHDAKFIGWGGLTPFEICQQMSPNMANKYLTEAQCKDMIEQQFIADVRAGAAFFYLAWLFLFFFGCVRRATRALNHQIDRLVANSNERICVWEQTH
jgi:hypothetical protein